MKTKFRLLAILLTLALLVTCLSACDSGGDSSAASDEGGDTASAAETSSEASSLEVDPSKVTLWLFAETHANYFEWVTQQYTEENPEVQFDIQVMDTTAMNDRLAVIINAGGEGTPDLIDMEQGQFPNYMTDEKMFFEPLNDYLEKDDLMDAIVEARLSLYAYNDTYYGLEHALCPVTMAYRPDLFEQAGAEVPTTYEEYMEAAELLAEQGIYIGAITDVATNAMGDAETFLLAADSYVVNDDGTPYIADNELLKQILDNQLYMQNNGMLLPIETDEDRWNAVAADEVATYITPDWAAGWLRDNVPEQSGQWEMTYLPTLTENSSRTSCNGGTGFCMSSYTEKDKELLWDFMKYAMIDADNCAEKYKIINLYPPVYDAMELCNGPVEYFNNQDLGALYTELAPEMPTQNQAQWRSRFGELMKNYSYDWYEGNMTTDELLQTVQEELESYIDTL